MKLDRPKRYLGRLFSRIQGPFKSVFVRNVGVLAGGTGLAQALMVLALPIITRLYSPEDFNIFAVYVSILGVISVAACLRLEVAIPLPEHDEGAANLLALALGSSAIVAVIAGTLVFLFPNQIVALVDQPALSPYLWLFPLGIWLSSSYSALQYWATRKKKFSTIAKTRLAQAIGGAGTQVGLGWVGLAPFGLLFGHMISSGSGILNLGRAVLRNDRAAVDTISWPTMQSVFRKYSRFPKYSTFDALANSAGAQLPVIMIAALAVGPEAGFLMLAMRAMQAPMGLLGGAVGQVFYSRAPEEYRAGNLGSFTADTFGRLLKTGAGPLIFVGIIAPFVVEFVFGESWQRTGEIVRWMTPWFIFQFLSSPVSMVMHVVQRQRELLWLTVFGLSVRVGSVFIGAYFFENKMVEAFSVGSAIYYFVLGIVVYIRAGCTRLQMLDAIRISARLLFLWLFIGVMLAASIELLVYQE